MNYRVASIFANKDLGESGTEIIPIRVKEPISRINLHYRVLKGMDAMAYPISASIEKIELVDGSDVLYSMDGGQNQALCIYDRKVPTMNYGTHINANSDRANYGIDFGRWLFDPELAFDPTKFRNPQLKVTYDEDKSDTLAGGGELEVWADIFDEKIITPIGFLMSKEIWNAAKPTSGYEYVDLPTDFPIRKMLLQPYYAAVAPWGIVDEARLDEDNEKRIPFDWNLEKYFRLMRGVWTPVEEPFQAHVSTSPYYLTPTDYWCALVAMSTNTVSYISGAAGEHQGGYFILESHGVGTAEVSGLVRGYLPNHCFEFPFGDPRDMADWYDVTRVGSLRLRLHAGAQDPTSVAVILQQLRRY